MSIQPPRSRRRAAEDMGHRLRPSENSIHHVARQRTWVLRPSKESVHQRTAYVWPFTNGHPAQPMVHTDIASHREQQTAVLHGASTFKCMHWDPIGVLHGWATCPELSRGAGEGGGEDRSPASIMYVQICAVPCGGWGAVHRPAP
eukprot:364378-Chlamydomonas_euryale.AAC.4